MQHINQIGQMLAQSLAGDSTSSLTTAVSVSTASGPMYFSIHESISYSVWNTDSRALKSNNETHLSKACVWTTCHRKYTN